MQKYGGAGPGHHTMLDALLPTVDSPQGSLGLCLRCALAMVVLHSCRHLLGARSTLQQQVSMISCWRLSQEALLAPQRLPQR